MTESDVLFEKWPIPQEFPVVIASAEAQKHRYDVYVGKSGAKWYVADVENPADFIYVTDSADWDKPGEGFGGRSIALMCKDSNGNLFEEELHGGWHSSSESFYQDTGIDIRDKHKTFVAVAKRRDAEYLYDVVYADTEPHISEFRRGEFLAKEYANLLNIPLVAFSRAASGAVIGMVYPE